MVSRILTVVFLVLATASLHAQHSVRLSDGTTLNISTLTTSIEGPQALALDASNNLWITERERGSVAVVDRARGTVRRVLTIAGGNLFGIALHPDFDHGSPLVFTTRTTAAGEVILERYHYDGVFLTEGIRLLTIPDVPASMGGSLRILPDRTMMLTVASFDTPTPSDVHTLNGKILRLTLDGRPATSNPYYDARDPAATAGYIYTFGHRNPLGTCVVPTSDEYLPMTLYAVECGARAYDEINMLQAGRHYGWFGQEGYCRTPVDTSVCPLVTFDDSPSAIAWYDSPAIPSLRRSLIVGTQLGRGLVVARVTSSGDVVNRDETKPADNNMILDGDHLIGLGTARGVERVRDVVTSPEGRIYVAVQIPGTANADRIVVIENPAYHLPLGVEDQPSVGGFTYGPNPATTSLTVHAEAIATEGWTIRVVDLMGRTLESRPLELSTTFDVASLAHGTYMLVLSNGTLTHTGAFVR